MAKRKKEDREIEKPTITAEQLTEEIRKKANEIYLRRIKEKSRVMRFQIGLKQKKL